MRFAVEARARQARFRAGLSPEAGSPDDDIGRSHGHLLALGHEVDNLAPPLRGRGGALDYFRLRRIKWWRSRRSGDVEGDGPTRNLASSQVACVNFLLPLAEDSDVLIELLRLIDNDVVGVVPIPDRLGGLPSTVELEWVGWDAPLEGGQITRGANQTSADALVVAVTKSGQRAYVFEWKHCEEYRNPADKGKGSSGATRRSRYAHRFTTSGSAFNGVAPLDEFLFEPFYQLMRLRLLADRICEEGVAPGVTANEARVIVVCPTANADYRLAVRRTPLGRRFPNLRTVEDIMHATLKDRCGLRIVAPEDLVSRLRVWSGASRLHGWLAYHEERYGW